jgi:hypothetical protein
VKSQIAVAALLIAVLASPARAQDQKPAPPAKPASSMTPATLKVQLVLSRYQGEKRVSSLPYTLLVASDDRNRFSGRASMRIGTQVPISTMAREGGANTPVVPAVQYRDVGTSIECLVSAREDGLYKIDLTIEDSSIEATAGGATSTYPSFRSFRVSDSVLLRHGQSTQASTATDKVGGEVWRVDVTLTVVQ